MGVIDIRGWKLEPHEVVANATGELDLNYCLTCLEYEHPDLFWIERLVITKQGEKVVEEEVIFRQGEGLFSKSISISDFFFEVRIK